MADDIRIIESSDHMPSTYPRDDVHRQSIVGWTFSEPYRIQTEQGLSEPYRDLIHPDGVVAFRHSVEGLIKHGSVLPERTAR